MVTTAASQRERVIGSAPRAPYVCLLELSVVENLVVETTAEAGEAGGKMK